jgi:arylsulfatase
MRDGQWKLVAKGARGPWELYDIAADRTELHNLAAKQPHRTQSMADAWEAWAIKALAKPWPYGKKAKKKQPKK